MATDTADFYLRLHEEVNAPAKRAREAVRALSGGLVAARSELARTERALTSVFRKQEEQRKGVQIGGISTGMSAFGLGVVGAGVAGLTAIAAAATSEVLSLAGAFAKTTAEAVDFGQRSRLAFGALIGDAQLGAKTFDEVRREAQRLGLDVRGTVDDFRLLLAAQFSIGDSKELMRAGSDLKAIGADAEHVKLALLALSQIKMKGVLQAEEMRQLVNTGVSAELIYGALAKRLGKTREQVLAMQRDRQITAPMAIEAFKTAIREKTHEGSLGETGAHFADSKITGMLAQARGRIENWFVDLGDRIEPAATRLASSAFGLFKELAESPELKGFADFVIKEFEGIESWTKEHWPEITDTVKSMFTDSLDGAKDLWTNVKGLFTVENIEIFKQTLKDLPSTVWTLVEPFVALAKALAAIAGFAKSFNQGNDDLGDWIGSKLGLDSKIGRQFLGYESNADRKKREGAAAAGMFAGAAAAGGAAGAIPFGKNISIGAVTLQTSITGVATNDPQELGDQLNKQVEQALMSMFDKAS